MTRIEALRQIVASNKAAKLDGHVVDTFTAARLLESYKALDGAGRRRFASMSVDKMVTAGDLSNAQRSINSAIVYVDKLKKDLELLSKQEDPGYNFGLSKNIIRAIGTLYHVTARDLITDIANGDSKLDAKLRSALE